MGGGGGHMRWRNAARQVLQSTFRAATSYYSTSAIHTPAASAQAVGPILPPKSRLTWVTAHFVTVLFFFIFLPGASSSSVWLLVRLLLIIIFRSFPSSGGGSSGEWSLPCMVRWMLLMVGFSVVSCHLPRPVGLG